MDPFKSGVIVLFCLVAVRCIDLPYRTFRCRNGTYIDDLLICDGKIDCVQPGDSLDEDFAYCDTSREECSPGTYKCAGISYFLNACRNATTRCNTIEDCLMYDEHPDEKDCGDEIKVDDCELNKGKYLCDDGLRCLDIRNTCDGFCNCFDCSDEKIECAIGEETFKSSNQACFKTPNGPFCCFGYNSLCQPCNSSGICEQNCVKFANQEKCFCNQTYNGVAGTNNARCELDNTSKLPVSDSNDVAVESSHQACFNTPNGRHCCSKYDTTCQECDLNDICEQKCVVFSNRTGCFCEENYVGIPGTNNSICFPRYNAAKEKLLLYSSAHGITAINLFTKETFTVKEFEEEGCEPSLIAAARNYVYYANVKGFGCSSVSIFRVSLTTSETREIIKTDEDLTSLAIDWITNNVYYSTSESLFVCNGFGRMCETLKSGEIYSLNLAPRFGLMFWVSRIEDSNQRITCNLTRSSMDGTGEKLLLTINGPCDVLWSVDESAERIYWYDSTTEQIQSVNFNGEKRMVLPFQLQLFNGGVEFRNTQHSSLDTDLVKTTKMAFGTIFENEIFFTDVQLKEIWSFEKNFEIFARRYPLPKISDSDAAYDLTQIKAIHVFNPSLHSSKFSNPCPASCSKLCLTRPPSSENSLNHNCNNSAKETSTISMGLIVCIILAMWLF